MAEITMAAGESLFRDVNVWSDQAHTVPHDITDATVTFEIRDRPAGNRVMVGGAQVLDGPGGKILIALEPVQTEDKEGSVLHYVVTLRESIGTTTVVDSGKVRILDAASVV